MNKKIPEKDMLVKQRWEWKNASIMIASVQLKSILECYERMLFLNFKYFLG